MTKWKDISILAIVITAIQMLLVKYLYPLIFANSIQQIYSVLPTGYVSPYTAIGSMTFGDKILATVSGYIPLNLGNFATWISMFIGAFLLLWAGYWVYAQRWAPWKGKTEAQRLWALMLYGSIALYIFLLVTKMSQVTQFAMPILIGVAVNYAIIAGVISLLAKNVKFLRI